MKIIQYECDVCGSIITDVNKVISLEGEVCIDYNGNENTTRIEDGDTIHFCCSHCASDYFNKLIEEATQ